MSTKNEAIKVLALHESQDDVEQMLNVIRNSGRAAHADIIEDREDLDALVEISHWDLILLRPEVNGYSALNCLKSLRSHGQDVPALMIADAVDTELRVNALRSGFAEVVYKEELDYLGLVVQREMKHLYDKRALQDAKWHLKETEQRCLTLLDSSRDAITYVIDGMITYANEAYLELFGYEDADELEGMPILNMVAGSDQEEFKRFLKQVSAHKNTEDEFVCQGVDANDNEMPTTMHFCPAIYDGEPCIQILIRTHENNNELQEKLREISSQDLLTGLFNRSYFTEAMESCIQWVQAGEGRQATLLYLQLDAFDAIQADVGIGGADIVLTDVANILRGNVGEQDVLARFGDEIFTLILRDIDQAQACERAEQLRVLVEDNMSEVQKRTVRTTCSIGVVPVSESSHDASVLLNCALMACDQVKDANPNGNGVSVFKPRLDANLNGQDIQSVIQGAVNNDLFKLLFQPIIDLRGGAGELYEAFLRMADDQGNEVAPGEFLGAAMDAEVSEMIDRWVIENAIKLLVQHRSQGHNTRLIINVTGKSITDPAMLSWIDQTLSVQTLPQDALIFQFREAELSSYLRQAIDFSEKLHNHGCKLSVSQFGACGNPFGVLKQLKFDYIKFDGEYVTQLDSEDKRQALRGLVADAHAQNKLTIAPLVESASILSTLWQIGVNFIQGYYLQAPTESMNYDFSADD